MKAQPEMAELADAKKQASVETVGAILKCKGSTVWSIAPEATVYEAIELMAEKGVGALAVVSNGNLAGIISERDYARKVILQGKSSKQTQVREIMSSPAFVVTPAYTTDDCLRIMSARRIHHLPVIDRDRMVGMLSIGDLVLSTISMQAYTIDQLETYIANKYPK